MNTTLLGRREPTRAAAPPMPARSGADYQLHIGQDARVRLARGWLWLALAALIGSGVFSVLLVASRTPGVNAWLPTANFFHVALVLHVDLSVMVWFVAMAGMLWSLYGRTNAQAAGWLGLWVTGAGTLAMALAPFVDPGEPVMSNYIPVLQSRLFLAGLVVFAAGTVLLVLRSLNTAPRLGLHYDGHGALHFGLSAAAVSAAVALLAFGWSWAVLQTDLDAKTYYEILFWGGGHALQFTWTLLMLVAWLWLASACGARVLLTPRVAVLLFLLALVGVFVTPYAYVSHNITSVEHRELLTWAMRLGGGPAIVPLGLAVVLGMATARLHDAALRPLRAALLSSIVLFAAGGVIGIFINGSNVRIPAHYHGCIVGVTLALMGAVYRVLPSMGYQAPQGRMATWQPWLYGIGQLMHIVGLVWSGGYGVQRKVAGSEQVLRSAAEVAGMGLMGLGGLVAIIGGLLFVVVVLQAMRAPARPAR
ncbi:cbb3-type cytochrome c oxidase subunit I [Comamonas sp. NLF-1-9]|uniref:cbb3-type cytochrome c oxidase subunit I n=1 Tax=Comamonas sp. NLF-1-9 TaxID=2853163 RepID=UPI001C484F8A|nr:cbb3-type cytochrome c oxidase subunit I [Comamonas sp. NLF-1-9]QXL83492.1 cbb3-type cytochrome c oxidase subunit I [Comamonas sp. NLF-1-9]